MPGIIFTDMWRDTIAYLQKQDPEMAKLPVETVFAGIVDQVVAARMQRPDGPGAPLL